MGDVVVEADEGAPLVVVADKTPTTVVVAVPAPPIVAHPPLKAG